MNLYDNKPSISEFKVDEIVNFRQMIEKLDATHKIMKTITFGIVISHNNPNYDEKSKMYYKQIRMIDDTFNYTQKIDNKFIKFHKFAIINFKAENIEDLPKCEKIGDIIMLKRFIFELENEGKEILGFQVSYSNWLMFDGQINLPFQPICYKNIQKNINRKIKDFEISAIKDLRCFTDKFFFQSSLKYINWWYESKEIDSNSPVDFSEKGIDLLLFLKEINKEKKVIEFLDFNKNLYKLNITSQIIEYPFKEKETYHFKNCLIIKKENYFLINYDYKTTFLRLISIMFESRLLAKKYNPKEEIKHNTNLPNEKFYLKVNAKKIELEFPFLKDYVIDYENIKKSFDLEKEKFIEKKYTSIKKKYFNIPYCSLKDVMNNKKFKVNEKFKIKANLIGINKETSNKNQIFKKVCLKCNKKSDLDKGKVQCCNELMKLVYYLVFKLKDTESDLIVDLYLVNNYTENFLFDLWRIFPKSDNLELWNNISPSDFDKFLEKLVNLCKEKIEISIVAETQKLKNKKYLQLIDTIFLP